MSASARVRARAARIVADVAERGRSLDAALEGDAGANRQERGLLRALSYDSVRWYIRLDALLNRLLSRPGQTLEADVRALAIVGLCQLLYTDIPDHAAVDETVNAARLLGQPRAAGLINAILRRAQRERASLCTADERETAERTAHPRWFVRAMEKDWPGESDAILAANNERPPFWIRVNRLRSTGADYRARLEAQGATIKASMFEDEALWLDDALDVADLPGFMAGEASVQDAAAQLAARLVAARAGERVLDACAAPGGKTGHLLELSPELSELVAVDISHDRLRRVAENLERLKMRATLAAADAAETTQWFDGRLFDRILLDAPCSGTGVIRRHPDIKLLRRATDVAPLVARQSQLLNALWPLLAPGGRLVYASCSVLRAETTAVVEAFLSGHPHARDVTSSALAPYGFAVQGEVGFRIPTGTGGMDGFYYACIDKE